MASSFALFSTARRLSLRKRSEKWKHWRLKSQAGGGGGGADHGSMHRARCLRNIRRNSQLFSSENEDDLYFLQRSRPFVTIFLNEKNWKQILLPCDQDWHKNMLKYTTKKYVRKLQGSHYYKCFVRLSKKCAKHCTVYILQLLSRNCPPSGTATKCSIT
jgi:hypothetical protein